MRLAMMFVAFAIGIAAIGGLFVWYALAVPGKSHQGPLAPLTPEERQIAQRLEAHVIRIASAPHNLEHYAELEAAARYLESTLKSSGYIVEAQPFAARGREVRNIEARRDAQISKMLIVGAHYDSFRNAPGANDNGSGVAVVLEMARLLSDLTTSETEVRFVLFVNEEPPYYRTPDMGSWHYAKRLSERGANVLGMISLETLGAFSDRPGSQKYPVPFPTGLPTTANFIAFVGLPGSRPFLRDVIGSFRRHTAFPTIGGLAPDLLVPGVGWSDHWAFERFGYPAMMITDTAHFRYPHYHQPSDTPDKLDYARLARITKGLERVLRDITR